MVRSVLPFAALFVAVGCRGVEYTLPDSINSAPVVTIVRPVDQATLLDTEVMEFEGLIVDDNGLLDVASVRWFSSLDGEIGREGEAVPDLAGRSRVATTLSAGVHTITLEATDAGGLSDTKSIAVLVDATRVEPVAEITSPLPFAEFWIGDTIPLEGTVWDPNQPAASLQITWAAVNAAGGTPIVLAQGLPEADGSTQATFASVPHGNWLVTLTVRDSDAHEADDALYVVVRDPDDVDADGDGWSPNQGDCDDTDDDVHPQALELCDNAVDDDCSGYVDDRDFDLDGHVDVACNLNDGPKRVDDCDDEDATVYAGAPEATDGVDNDCDGAVDDGTPQFDADGDCWCIGPVCTGSANPSCVVIGPGDCDDQSAAKNLDDDDADGWTTCEGDCADGDASRNLDDVDGDGYDTCDGDCNDLVAALNLDDDDLDGFTTCEGDCNDSVRFLNPLDADGDGASTCAGDCNDGDPKFNVRDDDGDGYSTCAGDCDDDNPVLDVQDFDHDGYSSCGGDCDDDDPQQNPADVDRDGWSTCDGDCDDLVPWLNLDDADNDTWSTCAGDCDDSLASMNLADADHDGWSTCAGDCDDGSTWWNPGDGDSDGSSTCTGDCNDQSPALNNLDLDDDGWDTCAGDCNDLVATLNRDDVDLDGWDTCEGDCNDRNPGLNLDDDDSDGWDTCAGDCNDALGSVNPGAADSPDVAFADANCDGIDGSLANGVFVTVGGSGSSACTRSSPCSLSRGLVVANTTSRKEIYVQAGTYSQVVDLPNGVGIWGGYNTSWVRASRSTAGHVVRIVGGYVSADAEYMTVRARSVTARMADLVLEGPDASGVRSGTLDGRSSYVVHAVSSTLTLERIDFDQGDGAAGAASGSHGANASQTRAASGGTGGAAREEVWACNAGDRGAPGGGGSNPSCTVANGGGGGWGGTMDTDCSPWWDDGDGFDYDARGGTSGGWAAYAPSPYGYPGGGGGTCAGGGAGGSGRVIDGTGGSAGNNDGRLIGAGFWYAFPGGSGSTGSDGTGGGGGGGSGGCDSGTDSWGAGGGGGGAGGCRATSGGGGGGGGGGSFGVFGYQSTITVTQSAFYRGRGGAGGKGGRMGAGQPGGFGGAGGWESPGGDSPFGGRGGDGGRGGHSGAGGGGAGGASFGIYTFGGSQTSSGNAYYGGAGGTSGFGGDLGQAGAPQSQAYGATGEGGLLGTTGLCQYSWDC